MKGIFIGGKSYDNTFYRVAVYEDCLPWLQLSGLKFELPLNPLEPEEAEIRVRGSHVATINAEERFLDDAIDAILTGCDPGLESRYRELVPLRLRGTLEWIIFSHEVLVGMLSFIHSLVLIFFSQLIQRSVPNSFKICTSLFSAYSITTRHLLRSNSLGKVSTNCSRPFGKCVTYVASAQNVT
jgi:hypothetical protein